MSGTGFNVAKISVPLRPFPRLLTSSEGILPTSKRFQPSLPLQIRGSYLGHRVTRSYKPFFTRFFNEHSAQSAHALAQTFQMCSKSFQYSICAHARVPNVPMFQNLEKHGSLGASVCLCVCPLSHISPLELLFVL